MAKNQRARMKYFACTIQETNGEQEYYHDLIIRAKNRVEAEKKAESYAQEFYPVEPDELPEKEESGYWHCGGVIFVEVYSLRPTTKRAWMQEQFKLNLVA